ncbi:MAG TPA: lysylphosphatidylglycerol synthase transmembrane domain-containing protein [Methanocorpusculum sp.]|nr:lysylphosphatidylglycerol synthase transmembrane domain-containing protein [Methanocorpusculum sp.]
MNWKKIAAIVIPTVIAVGLIVFMFFRIPFDELKEAVAAMNLLWLPLAIGICIGAWFLRGVRYKYILHRLASEVSVLFATGCIFVSQTANIIVPARLGDFVRMFILKHEKQTPYTPGFTSLVAERVYDILVIAFLGLCTIPFIITLIPPQYQWFIWLMAGVLALGAAGIIVFIAVRKVKSENKVVKKILEIIAQFRAVSSTWKAFGALSGLSIIIWLMDVAICYIVAVMFGCTINPLLVLLAIVIGNLVKAVPITPGGIGTYEVALMVVFEFGGVPAAVATLIAVVDHLIKNGVTLIGGIISMYGFGNWAADLLKRLFKEGKKVAEQE